MSCCAEHQVMASGSAWIMSLWSTSPYLATALLGPPLLLLMLVYPALLVLSPKERKLPLSAGFYTSIDSKEPEPLPSLVKEADHDEDSGIQLSIVVPAYNEEERLTTMLDEAHAHLEARLASKQPLAALAGDKGQVTSAEHVHTALSKSFTSYEILIIDDGSRDRTADVALAWARDKKLDSNRFRLVRLGRNCGKGKAVRHGVLHARGQLIAYCDADGATRFSDIDSLLREMARIVTPQGHGIVCGSRAHLVGSEAVVKRSFARNLLMHSFHFILSLLMRPPNPLAPLQRLLGSSNARRRGDGTRAQLPTQPIIRDTQCGFKLLTRPSAKVIFPLAHIDRWIFDVELLLLAEMASEATLMSDPAAAARATAVANTDSNFSATSAADPLLRLPLPISEVAVEWKEVAGSKIDILTDSVQMGLDLIVIRLNYALGRWRRPQALQRSNAAQGDTCCTSEKRNGDHAASHSMNGHAQTPT